MSSPASDAPETPEALPDQAACSVPAKGLRRAEKVELAILALLVPALFVVVQALSFEWTLRWGALVAYAAGLLLAQGLVRDLVRLAIEGRKTPTQSMLCLCAESTIGLATLAGGVLLLAAGIRDTLTLTPLSLTGLVAGVLATGFVVKDYVLVIRKVADHGSISIG